MLKEDTDMAGKKAVNKSKGQPQFPIGTRHSYAPTLTTLIRTPVPLPFNDMGKAPAEAKREFIYGLLKAAGTKGITWPAIQQALTAKYGQAPKKRAILYSLLGGLQWHKGTGGGGIVLYRLGKPTRKAK
jgi:hypothetical protein